MGAIEEGSKTVGTIVEAMKSAPLAIALLVINAGFIFLTAYLLNEIGGNARERNASQVDLIKTLIKECGPRAGRPPIYFRSRLDRAKP